MPSSSCFGNHRHRHSFLHDALPIFTELMTATKRPEHFIGLHFFNPVPLMKLVEVVRTIATAPDVYETAYEFAKKLGKVPVRTSDKTDRKSTRLNSSHVRISYAVFILLRQPPTSPLFPTRRSSDLHRADDRHQTSRAFHRAALF